MLVDAKHHEILGHLMPNSENFKKEWKEMQTKDGITISMREGPKEEILMRRIDLMIKCPAERIAKHSMDLKKWGKILTPIKSVENLEQIKDVQITLVKCEKLSTQEPEREALVAMHMKKLGNITSVIRTSIEMDKAPKPEEGSIRQIISISGMVLQPSQNQQETMVSMMVIGDMIRPFQKESMLNLEKMMMERIMKFR